MSLPIKKLAMEIVVRADESVAAEMCHTDRGEERFLHGIDHLERELNQKAQVTDPLEGEGLTWTDNKVYFVYTGKRDRIRRIMNVMVTEARFFGFDKETLRIEMGLCPICGDESIGKDRPRDVLPYAGDRCLKLLTQIRQLATDRQVRTPTRNLGYLSGSP